MLTVKRLVTAGICFVLLTIVIFLGGLIVGGAVVGGIAGANNPENAAQAGREAGERFGEAYGGLILLASVGLAGVSSGILAFGGVLPWCRKKEPPVPPEVAGVNDQRMFERQASGGARCQDEKAASEESKRPKGSDPVYRHSLFC